MDKTIVTLSLVIGITNCGVLKQSLYMDKESGCSRTIRNTGMEQGDLYTVKSDQYNGMTPPNKVNKQPGTCSMVIDFGTRLIQVSVQEWKCSKNFTDTFLGIYDTCDSSKKKEPLMSLTCTANQSQSHIRTVSTTGQCVTLYHHRGYTKVGYYFLLDVRAGPELMSFPVGVMATIIVSSVVAIMILVKIVCMVTGYENKLPKLNLTKEEEKKILEEATLHIRLQQALATEAEDSRSLLVGNPPENLHSSVSATHSNLSNQHSISEFEYEFLNMHTERTNDNRVRRYPSYRTASIFKH